jgi:hypothetical protein
VNSTETLREFYADPERRLRAVIIRRAGEMGRAARALSDWLGVLRQRAAAAGISGGIGPGREGQVRDGQAAILVMRAQAWANALRRRLILVGRHDKAATLWPDFAPVTHDLRTPGAADAPGGAAVGADEADEAAAPVEAAVAPAAAVEPAASSGVVFLVPAKLDAALRAAEARALRPPKPLAFDKVPPVRAPKPERDARQRLEDKIAAEMIARLSAETAAERVFTYLGAAADRLEDQAAAAQAAAEAAAAAKAARWQRPVSLWSPAPRAKAAGREQWPGPMLGGRAAPDTG